MLQYLYPLYRALIGSGTLSPPCPEESLAKEPVLPLLQHSEHPHYTLVHLNVNPPPVDPPIVLWTPETPTVAVLSWIYPPIIPLSLPLVTLLHIIYLQI